MVDREIIITIFIDSITRDNVATGLSDSYSDNRESLPRVDAGGGPNWYLKDYHHVNVNHMDKYLSLNDLLHEIFLRSSLKIEDIGMNIFCSFTHLPQLLVKEMIKLIK